MAETSGFFNAEELSDGSYDREYFAQQFAYYFALFIGNGIFMTDTDKLKVVQNTDLGMYVKVLPGDAFINGYWYNNSTELVLSLENASASLNRIDSVVIRWNVTTREIKTVVKKGTEADEPISPAIQKDSSIYELEIARIIVNKAQTGITDAEIQDMRLNSDSCGIVTGVIDQVDMTSLFNQFTSWYNQFTTSADSVYNTWTEEKQNLFDVWFAEINAKLGEEPATNLQLQIDGLKNDVLLNTGNFTDTAPYTAVINVPNLKTTDAISIYVARIPVDTDETFAANIKLRKKYISMIDDAECSENGKLKITCANKKPQSFDFYLRGCSTQ